MSERVARIIPGDEQTVAEPPNEPPPPPPPPPPSPRRLGRALDAVCDWIFTGKAR